MSKKHRKISLAFIAFLLTLLTIVSFAEPPEAPNQLITENPYKEVKTVEANKNREHAEMNISVNKLNIKEIEGVELETGEIFVILPLEKNEKMILDEIYYITNSLDNLPDVSTINNNKKISNSIKIKNKILTKDNKINFRNYKEYLIIEKNNEKNLFVTKLNKSTGEIKSVSKINFKTVPIKEKLNGILSRDKKELKVRFGKKIETHNSLNKNVIYIYSVENEKNVNSFKKIKTDFYEFELLKEIKNEGGNFYEDILKITSEQKITNDLHLLSIDENKMVQKIEIKAGILTERSSLNGHVSFYKFINPELVKYQGKKYLWFGNFLRINRHISGGETEDGLSLYNFSFPMSGDSRTALFEMSNASGTKKKMVDLRYETRIEESLIAGHRESTRDSYFTSGSLASLEKKYGNLSSHLAKYNLSLPPSLGGEHYGWILSNKVLFEITSEIENLLTKEGYKKIKNMTKITAYLRFWNPNPAYDIFRELDLIGINEINQFVKYIGNVKIDLANPMVAGTGGNSPGRIRIYSSSISSMVPLVGNLGNDDMIISSNIKNGQYKLNKASGTYIPIIPNELGGNKVDITINTGGGDFKKTNDIHIGNSNTFNGMMSTAYNGGKGGIEVGVDYQESVRSNYGTDISLTDWDLEAKNIKVIMKHPLIENTFNITVPEFDSEVYYNKLISQVKPTEIDYSNKTIKGFFVREHSGEMKFKFNVGTKDYDLRILGTDNGKTNLSIKIPKQVILEVTDSLGNKQLLPFITEVIASVGILGEDTNNYYIHAPNDGWTGDSTMNGIVTLKTMYKTNITSASVNGNNLNLVSIGATSSRTGREKRTTIIDKVDLKVELINFNETIDVSSLKISEKLVTNNGFYGLIQNENKIVLKDGTTEIFNITFESLKTNPQQILDAGIAIKYDEGTNKFQFIKEKYRAYDKDLKLEIKTSSNLLLYVINLHLKNSSLVGLARERRIIFTQEQLQKIHIKNPTKEKVDIILTNNGDVYFTSQNQQSTWKKLILGIDYTQSGITNFNYSNDIEIYDRSLLKINPSENERIVELNNSDIILNSVVSRMGYSLDRVFHSIGKNIWGSAELFTAIELYTQGNNLENFIAKVTSEGTFTQSIEMPIYDLIKKEAYLDTFTIKVEKTNIEKQIIDLTNRKISTKVSANQNFLGMVRDNNKIMIKDGTEELLNTTIDIVKNNLMNIKDAGVAIKYDEGTNKFEFIKEKYVEYNKNLKLEIRTPSNDLLYNFDLQIINSSLETNAVITFDFNNFNMMKGDTGHPYGRVRVYPQSVNNLISKIGILDSTDAIVTDENRKNGQFLQGKVTGDTYPLQQHHSGKTMYITVGTNKREVKIANDLNGNPIGTHDFGNQNGIRVFVDYQSLNISNGGIDFAFADWNGRSNSIPIKVEYPDGAISNYTIVIPELNIKNYYNKDLPGATVYLATKKHTKEINEFMDGELDRIRIGTKDYDMRIIGRVLTNIKKKITLKGKDSNGVEQDLEFNISIEKTQNMGPVVSIDENTFGATSNTSGYMDADGSMSFDLVLKGSMRNSLSLGNIVTLKGSNLKLVEMFPDVQIFSTTKETIIDELEYTINFVNSSEIIDFRDENKGAEIFATTSFEALDTNRITIKESGTALLTKTIAEFKQGVELPDSGIKIYYDSSQKKLKFEKIGYKDYSNENLVLELRSKENLLLRVISLKLYNKVGFEILPGKGMLEFGHFIPGDFKRAESLIEFKNLGGAKISVDLNPLNDKNMYKLGVPIEPNTTIPLSNIQIKDLKNGINNTNNFKISGEAKTTKNTEVGEYKGKLDVIITIIP